MSGLQQGPVTERFARFGCLPIVKLIPVRISMRQEDQRYVADKLRERMSESQFTEIEKILEDHERWRGQCWNLIAGENIASRAVSKLLSSDLAHRYGDYEGIDLAARKYRGNRFVVQIERCCQELAQRLFGARHVDLRPLSGHIAGVAPLFALCKPHDKVLELNRECGGHRLAAKLVNCPLVQLHALSIPFDIEQFNIDVQGTLSLIERERPRIVILGSSTFLFPHPVSQLRAGLDSLDTGTILQYDGSHVLGLIAGKQFQQPLAEGADLVTSSTHKTLAGPQGGGGAHKLDPYRRGCGQSRAARTLVQSPPASDAGLVSSYA
jgi:glycine hydroxymethyltransferase